MALSEQQLKVIKQQRAGLNDAIEKNRSYHSGRIAHAYSVNSDFHTAILTISLGLGSAIVPLILLGEGLKTQDVLSLSMASFILIANSVYLALVLKNRTERLSQDASAAGLKETVTLVKLRNLLTKSILTREEEYFKEFNLQSRSIAEDSINVLENREWARLNYSTDICITALATAAMLVLKPIVAIESEVYFSVSVVILVLMVAWFAKQTDQFRSHITKASELNSDAISEEKDFNQFVRTLIEKNRQV